MRDLAFVVRDLELCEQLGKSLGEFKKGQKEGTEPDKIEDEVENKEIDTSDESEKKD